MADRKVFLDSVTPLPDQAGLTHNGLMVNAIMPEHKEEPMTVLFSLALPKESHDDLEARVARGEVVPLDELQQKYRPNPEDIEALQSWLTTQGYEIVRKSDDGTSVYARASVDNIEKSLHVNMVRVT